MLLSQYRSFGRRRQCPFARGSRSGSSDQAHRASPEKTRTYLTPWVDLDLLDRDGFLCVGLEFL